MMHLSSIPKKKRLSMPQKEELWGYVFIAPWLIGFLVFMLLPMLFSLYASFTNYDVTSKMDFIGLGNYKRMFSDDQLFWVSLKNTLYYVVFMVPLTTVASLFLALLLNQKIRGMRIFRTVFYLPAVLSGVGVFLLWMQMLSPNAGLINMMLHWFGVDGPNWLTDPAWTKNAIILMKLWGVGGSMLLYLASLQGVPNQLYEAATIDGANAFQRLRHITLPMITPVIFFDLVTSTIGGFQIFQEGYVIASSSDNVDGGPSNSLLFYNFHLWNKAFKTFEMGYASAMAWVLFAIVLLLTVINLKLAKRWVYYEGGDGR